MGVYCCKTEDNEEQQMSECANVYETKPCTLALSASLKRISPKPEK